jgi:Fe-coproporphyrin III synthase
MKFVTETGSAGSTVLMLHLLGRCNLTCLHCYMNGAPTRKERLPVDLVIRAATECPRLGIGALYLTGGEPLLFSEFQDVLKAAASMHLDLTVCTNGTLLTERHAAMLREAHAHVNISVDGDIAFHDSFRNAPEAFQATQRGCRIVAEAGIPLTIVSSISQANLQLLPFLAEWAARMGASEFRAQPMLQLGRGLEFRNQSLTNEQMNHVVLQLSALDDSYRPTGMACSLVGMSLQSFLAYPSEYVGNGDGGRSLVGKEIKKVVVLEDGTVLPEITNLSRKFALGRIEDAPLVELVARYFENGYDRFDDLRRSTHQEIMSTWKSAVVPWDQILAEKSYLWSMRPVARTGVQIGGAYASSEIVRTSAAVARQKASSA